MKIQALHSKEEEKRGRLAADPRSRLQPVFTLRGGIFFIFTLWLIFGPTRQEADIVAATLGMCFGGALLLCLIAVTSSGLWLKKNLTVLVSSDQGEDNSPAAGDVVTVVYRFSDFRVPPFLALSFQSFFQGQKIQTARHFVYGKNRVGHFFPEKLVFPHRGLWHLDNISLSVGDNLGLFSFKWNIDSAQVKRAFSVRPKPVEDGGLPVLSSSTRAGDEVLDMQERTGEYFDLKPYNPADGMRKIFWKVFAKRGELISRHPEHAMTPEGLVLIFCIADRSEDHVCARAVSYVRRLKDLDLNVSVGCEGMENEPPASDARLAEDLFIKSVWDTGASPSELKSEASAFLSRAKTLHRDTSFRNILVFFAPGRLHNRQALEGIVSSCEEIEAAGASPVLIPCEKSFKSGGIWQGQQGQLEKLKAFFISPIEKENGTAEGLLAPDLYAVCAHKHWMIIL